jgi:hypothetical protein
MVSLTATLNCFPHPFQTRAKFLSTLICCPWAYSSSLTQLYPHFLALFFGFWVTCGVIMLSLCHGQGWLPPQTTSLIIIRQIKSFWAHWYAVHGYTVAALHSYAHPTWPRSGGSGSLMQVKMMPFCHGWGWQPLQTASCINFRHIKVFEHIDMLSMGVG